MDEDPQDTPSARKVADGAVRLLVDAAGEEPLELLAPLVEDADRGVAGAGQLQGDVEQAIEDGLGIELRDQRAPDIQQAFQPCRVHAAPFYGRPESVTSG